MPRRKTPSAKNTYHVTVRCNNKDFLLNLPINFKHIVSWLNTLPMFYQVDIHHVLFMSNHIHLMVTPQKDNFGSAMCYFLTNLAKYLNGHFQRKNHIFANRYSATAIVHQKHYLNVIRYIYQNPVRAQICRHVEDYKFSSFHQYMGTENSGIFLTPDTETERLFKMGTEGLQLWKDWIDKEFYDYENVILRDCFKRGKFQFTKRQFSEVLNRTSSLTF